MAAGTAPEGCPLADTFQVSWVRVFRRAGRRTNAALLLLCAGAFLTGWLAFASGTPAPATVTTVAHGLLGLGVVAVAPWKNMIVLRSRRIPPGAWALIVLTLVCLAAGFGQFLLGYHLVGGVSPIQVHVGAALVALPLMVGHVRGRRRQRLRRSDLSRRALLRTGAFILGTGLGYLGLIGAAGWTRRSAGRVATGSGRIDAADVPATNWLLDRVPEIDPAAHRVQVAGLLLSPADLAARAKPVLARLDCTSGWYAEATWSATALADLVSPGHLAAARSIEVTSVTGYTRRFDVAEAGDLWLATSCQGQPLSAGTGAPVRLVAPHRRGFWWVKWVASVRLSDRPAWVQLPFPPQ